MLRRPNIFRVPTLRWGVVLLTCAAVLWASSGLVVVPELAQAEGFSSAADVEAKETTESFPCAGHSCGCMNAMDCKHHCCCDGPKTGGGDPAAVEYVGLSIRSAACGVGGPTGLFQVHVDWQLPETGGVRTDLFPRAKALGTSASSPALAPIPIDPFPPRPAA